MENVLTIPRSQCLRFINESERDNAQTYDNRLVTDLVYAQTLPYNWIQPILNTDNLWIQFITNYVTYKCEISDCDGNIVDLTSLAVLINTDNNSLRYYNLYIDTSLLDDYYQISIRGLKNVDGVTYQNNFLSEVFEVRDSFVSTRQVEWRGNERTYNDKMHWDGFDDLQFCRFYGTDKELGLDHSKTTYQDSDYASITLQAKPLRNVLLEFEDVPFWVPEKINLGLSHDEFYMNGVQYNSEEPPETEQLDRLLTVKGSIRLTEIDYENGEYETLSDGDAVIVELGLRTTGLEARSTGIVDRKYIGVEDGQIERTTGLEDRTTGLTERITKS